MSNEDEVFEVVGTDIYDLDQANAIIWWLVHLLGGSVVFPVNEAFWLEEYPTEGARVVLRRERGTLVLTAEKDGEPNAPSLES